MNRRTFNTARERLTAAIEVKDVVQIREVLSAPPFWCPDTTQDSAIVRCMAYLERDGEEWVKAWTVLSLNEFSAEQERVVLVSTRAYYRAKYDFRRASVVRFQRIPLSMITRIEYGRFQVAPWSLTGKLVKEKIEAQSGLRVFTAECDGGKSPGELWREANGEIVEHSRTYIPSLSREAEAAEGAAGRVVEEMAQAFEAALALNPEEGVQFPITYAILQRDIPGGLISLAHNELGLGRWN